MGNIEKEWLVYQWKNGEILLREDAKQDTIWANLNQISDLFTKNKSTISRHIKNIYESGELDKKWTVAKIATVQKEWERQVEREVEYYNLDMIISIWYRVDSKEATEFRKWSTEILKKYITQWFVIDSNKIEKHYHSFMSAVDDVKKLLPENSQVETKDILELIQSFAHTWMSLESYDEDILPESGFTQSDLILHSDELYGDIGTLKEELISKKQATELFAQEKTTKALEWIFWNIFQSFGWEDVYPSLEEKAAHFLYFVVKNHVFVDGNKRTGAFCFIWFMQKSWFHFSQKVTPEALTALTLLVAESKASDKRRIVWLIILMLQNTK